MILTLLLIVAILIAVFHEQFKSPLWMLSVAVVLLGLMLVIERLGVLR